MTRKTLMTSHFNCIIIGAGISGITAAIYLKRANINVLLLEKEMPGGQINKTYKIENYPGFSSIDGPTLAQNLYDQIKQLKIDYRYGNVKQIEIKANKKVITTDMGEYTCDYLIIATGRVPRKLNIPNEQKLIGHGISYCAICDGSFFKDETIAVIGGGNSALEEALYLSNICKKVLVLYRKDNLRADQILQGQAKSKENIEIKYNSTPTRFIEKDNQLSGVEINNNEILNVSGAFIYIGYEPNNEILKNLPLEYDNDYIIVNEKMETNIPGIYACGDIIKKDLYQLTTATSEGTTAAISIKQRISEAS